jgi:hypothetical protein
MIFLREPAGEEARDQFFDTGGLDCRRIRTIHLAVRHRTDKENRETSIQKLQIARLILA